MCCCAACIAPRLADLRLSRRLLPGNRRAATVGSHRCAHCSGPAGRRTGGSGPTRVAGVAPLIAGSRSARSSDTRPEGMDMSPRFTHEVALARVAAFVVVGCRDSRPVPRLLQVLSHAQRSRAVEGECLDFGGPGPMSGSRVLTSRSGTWSVGGMTDPRQQARQLVTCRTGRSDVAPWRRARRPSRTPG